MAKDEKEAPAEAPKKSKKMLIIIAAVVLLGGGGAGAYFMLKPGKSTTTPAAVKGIVTPLDEALTINLSDGHYLKLNFALQETADAGVEVVDTSEAKNLAIDIYTGKAVAELSTEKGRKAAKEALLAAIVKAYTEDKVKKVMEIYFTSFVTQ
ncbi:MAG: flagellar protein FliL [Actinoplanes sp.]|jgi:flagellar FliL protein|nr:flagellar protein FliL [Actinoplanes sp.]